MAESSRSISPASDLPSEDVRESLLDAVTTLLRRMGFEPLVSGPLVVGTAAFFPEPVPRTVGGLRGLLRRLLVFAGTSFPARGRAGILELLILCMSVQS